MLGLAYRVSVLCFNVLWVSSAMAQSQGSSAVEQIAPSEEYIVTPAPCLRSVDEADCIAYQDILLQTQTHQTDAPLVLKEDGAYLRLDNSVQGAPTDDAETVLDLNPLTPSE